jgi:hypothetical protein
MLRPPASCAGCSLGYSTMRVPGNVLELSRGGKRGCFRSGRRSGGNGLNRSMRRSAFSLARRMVKRTKPIQLWIGQTCHHSRFMDAGVFREDILALAGAELVRIPRTGWEFLIGHLSPSSRYNESRLRSLGLADLTGDFLGHGVFRSKVGFLPSHGFFPIMPAVRRSVSLCHIRRLPTPTLDGPTSISTTLLRVLHKRINSASISLVQCTRSLARPPVSQDL